MKLSLLKRNKTFITKKLTRMIVSGTFTLAIICLLLMSDTLIAGFRFGVNAAAATSIISPIYTFSAFISSLFVYGLPVLYSEAIGKFKKEEANKIFGTSFTLCVISSIVLFSLAFFGGDLYLSLFNIDEKTYQFAKDYLFFYRFVVLVLPFETLIITMTLVDGDEKINLIAVLSQVISNLLISILSSKSIGIKALGLGCFVGNALSIIIASSHFLKKNNTLKINLTFSSKIFKKIIKFGVVDASTFLCNTLLFLLLDLYITHKFSSDAIIIVSTLSIIKELLFILDGVGEGLVPITSIYLAEGDTCSVKRIFKKCFLFAIVEGVILNVILFAISPYIPIVLGIDDLVMKNLIIRYVRIVSFCSTFTSLVYLFSSYYIAKRKIGISVFMSISLNFIFDTLFSILFSSIFKLEGFAIAALLSPIVTLFLSLLFVLIKYGKSNFPYLNKDLENINMKVFNLVLNKENIVTSSIEIKNYLKSNNIPDITTNRILLLFEELLLLIADKNKSKKIYVEIQIKIEDDSVCLFFKDDGVIFDITSENLHINSMGVYLINLFNSIYDKKKHFIALSFNHNAYKIPIN